MSKRRVFVFYTYERLEISDWVMVEVYASPRERSISMSRPPKPPAAGAAPYMASSSLRGRRGGPGLGPPRLLRPERDLLG